MSEGSTVHYFAEVGYNWLAGSTMHPSNTDPEVWQKLTEIPWVQMDLLFVTFGEDPDGPFVSSMKSTIKTMLMPSVLRLTGEDDLYMRIINTQDPNGYHQPFLEGAVKPEWRDQYKKMGVALLEVHFWVIDGSTQEEVTTGFYQKFLHPHKLTELFREREQPMLIPMDAHNPTEHCCTWLKRRENPHFIPSNN